jgi:hypothetical protein
MTKEALLASQAAICVAQFMKQPNHQEKLKEFQGLITGNTRTSFKKGAGIKCPGKKMLALLSLKHAARGLNCLRKNETAQTAHRLSGAGQTEKYLV